MRYWIKNLIHRLRGTKAELLKIAEIGFTSELSITVKRSTGTIEDFGVVSRRCVTNAGVNYLAVAFTGSGEPENFNYHDCGEGSTSENATDTTLETPFGGSRVSGTQSNPASKQYKTVASIAFTGPKTITEHGLFSASTSGTLWDRSVFAAIPVANLDEMQFAYTLTVNSGG
jgi:hypothetical protein